MILIISKSLFIQKWVDKKIARLESIAVNILNRIRTYHSQRTSVS